MYEPERERVTWALEALPKLLPLGASERNLSDPEIWILAHGFSNAFYSIREMLGFYKQTDALAWRLQSGWQAANNSMLADIVIGFRNLLTHQGKFSLTSKLVTFVAVEAAPPPRYEIYQTTYAAPGRPARAYTMGEWVEYTFTWLRSELQDLSDQYERAKVGSPPL